MPTCKTCELITRRDQGIAPAWDCIHRTTHWDVAHCYETAVPGWLVLVARRHVASLAELTGGEAAEMGILIHNISFALTEVTNCIRTYVLQFAESPQHQHIHFHIVPRMPDLPDDHRAAQIFKYLGVPENERVSQEEMNDIALKIQKILQKDPA